MSLVTRSANRNAYDPRDLWGNDFDAFVTRVFGTPAAPTPAGFPVDVYEDENHLHIDAELPGFARDQIDVTIDRRVLTVSAERSRTASQTDAEQAATTATATPADGEQPKLATTVEQPRPAYYLRERTATRVARSFTLPDTIDASSVDARLVDGVLQLTLNKRQETKPRKISIG